MQWVCRDIDQDYGFDCEVELFDAGMNATGERFLVQLKATDSDTDKPRIRLRPETVDYYEKSALPVLLVRYGATRKELHARWFHTLDPYRDKPSASGLTVKFAESDRLTTTNVGRLATEAGAYLSLRGASPSTPIHFDLRIATAPIRGVKRIRLYGDLRHLAVDVQSTLEVSLETNALEKPLNLISVDSEKIEVTLAGITTSVTFRTDDYSAVPSALAHDILLVVGLAFERLGQAARGAALLEIAWPHSQLARTRTIYTRVAVTLFKAGKGKQLIDYARLLLDTQSDEDLAIAFDLLTLTYVDFSTSQVVNDARAVEMARFAAIMVAKNHRPQAAAMYYNIAGSFRARHDFRNALRNYRRACIYDPQYCSRAYYCKELAGVLFLLRRYSMSARFYELAFEIDADRTTLPLLADAHMFRGEYALAQSTLKTYFEGEPRVEDSDWHLKLLALDEIQERARTGSQRRRRATHSLDPATATERELQAHYEDSIATDGLDGFAWVNLGRLFYRLGKLAEALGCLLVAVAIVPHDAESWAGVIAISRKLDLTALFGLALAAAHQSLGTEIFEHLPDMGVVGDELIARLERLHAPDLTTTVRFPRPDGAVGTATLVHRRGGRES